MIAGRRIRVRGAVQGVGFRPHVYRLARRHGLSGTVQNGNAGVSIEAFGPEEELERFVVELRAEPPPAARIDLLSTEAITPRADVEFRIVESDKQGDKRASIPADLATCDDCLREIFDPFARRFRYPFTNCTACGPRFTIAEALPYDRATTTMARFTMCAACQREYEDPLDRRFHAEPIACPACGPKLRLVDRSGTALPGDDPIRAAALLLLSGAIVAVHGLGGFHLACLATCQGTVERLRVRKRREHKPLAVMVKDLDTARRVVRLRPAEERLLSSNKRPIVLCARAEGLALAPAVAPDSARVGVMLPYTPLHHLLLAEVDRPLVMTSGNASDEPMATTETQAMAALSGIADAFLVHDRPIAARADDSVTELVRERPALLRRARGWVPEPISAPVPFLEPVLAVGGQLKNTFCIGVGDQAYLGPHVGDLDDLATHDDFTRAIARLERFLGVSPRVVACDLHPAYASTAYARARGGRVVPVQHHHAHLASAIAEHHLEGPVIGVIFDGTGYGTDGAAWGGEVFTGDLHGFERMATLRPIALAGGDKAIKDVWRVALAALIDAYDGDPPLFDLHLFDRVPVEELAVVREMVALRVGTVQAHGAGRWFDAVAAIALARPRAFFEGQLPMALEQAADPRVSAPYPWALHTLATPWQIDLRPALRAAVGEAAYPEVVAARFHETLIASTAAVVRRVIEARGPLPVVLTGGCFQNVRLAEGLASTLERHAQVYLHERVPAGDGGLALGQAAVAAARGDVPCV